MAGLIWPKEYSRTNRLVKELKMQIIYYLKIGVTPNASVNAGLVASLFDASLKLYEFALCFARFTARTGHSADQFY